MATLAPKPSFRQANVVSRSVQPEGNELSLIRECLRRAIDQSQWKHDALAVEIGVSNAAYLSNMLSGEKPIQVRHLRALPDDVEALFAKFYAESFGLVVTVPITGRAAIEALVSGLIGVLTAPQLPDKFKKHLKTSLQADEETE